MTTPFSPIAEHEMPSSPRPARPVSDQKFSPSWWAVVFHPHFIIRRRLQQAIAERADRLEGNILDLGCGSKPYERYFRRAKRYVGVDIAESGHDHETSKVDLFYDGATLPFEADVFDGVVSFETFEHIFNLEAILGEIIRVLVPGGSLMATLPFAYPEHETPYDFGRYTRYGLSSLLSRIGFEEIEIQPTSTSIEAIGQLISTYLFGYLCKRRITKALVQLFVGFPVTVLTLCASRLLPKDDSLYCNLVVTARKPSSATAEAPLTGDATAQAQGAFHA